MKSVHKFPPKWHLKLRRDIRRVYDRRCRISDQLIVIFISENDLQIGRVAFSTAAQLGKAVIRNRYRRLLKEAYRLEQIGRLYPGFDIICIPRPSPKTGLTGYRSSLKKLLSAAISKLAQSS